MFGILAKALHIASRTEDRWTAPSHWVDHDHRTHAEKQRDAQDRRRLLRGTGLL